MKFLQIMINIQKPKPINLFGRSMLKNKVEKYIHAFMHLCLFEYDFYVVEKKRVSDCISVMREVSRQNGFIFNQINKLTLRKYSNLSNINILCYLILRIPIMHRQFFKIVSQNLDYVQTHYNDRNIPVYFACRKWYLYNNPQSKYF